MEKFKNIEMPEVPAGYTFEDIKRENGKIVMVCKKNPDEGMLMVYEGQGIKALYLTKNGEHSTSYSHAFVKEGDKEYVYDTDKALLPDFILKLIPHEIREADEDEMRIFTNLLAEKQLVYNPETRKVNPLYIPQFGDIVVKEESKCKYIYLKSQEEGKLRYTAMLRIGSKKTLYTHSGVIIPATPDCTVRRATNDETAMLVDALEEQGYIIKDKIIQRKQCEVHFSVSPKVARKVTVYARIAELAEELNEGWKKQSNEDGWFIKEGFDAQGNMVFSPAHHASVTYPGIIYFKSPDLVQRAIKLVGRDLYAFYK